MIENKDVIFTCNKCEHRLYIGDISIEKLEMLLSMDCPICGEEGYENWTLYGFGNYDEVYGGTNNE